VFRVSTTARLLIIGQAPGTKVHATGIPWNDPSGDRRIAIVPMGFCYPGRLPNGGDAPPRRECAPLWHERLIGLMLNIELTLLVGSYAQAHVLGRGAMTAHVGKFREYLPDRFPLPHPSWRTTAWERKNPWFETEALPELRRSVAQTLLEPSLKG
jgi:uracil-DNA glycosylase